MHEGPTPRLSGQKSWLNLWRFQCGCMARAEESKPNHTTQPRMMACLHIPVMAMLEIGDAIFPQSGSVTGREERTCSASQSGLLQHAAALRQVVCTKSNIRCMWQDQIVPLSLTSYSSAWPGPELLLYINQ